MKKLISTLLFAGIVTLGIFAFSPSSFAAELEPTNELEPTKLKNDDIVTPYGFYIYLDVDYSSEYASLKNIPESVYVVRKSGQYTYSGHIPLVSIEYHPSTNTYIGNYSGKISSWVN